MVKRQTMKAKHRLGRAAAAAVLLATTAQGAGAARSYTVVEFNMLQSAQSDNFIPRYMMIAQRPELLIPPTLRRKQDLVGGNLTPREACNPEDTPQENWGASSALPAFYKYIAVPADADEEGGSAGGLQTYYDMFHNGGVKCDLPLGETSKAQGAEGQCTARGVTGPRCDTLLLREWWTAESAAEMLQQMAKKCREAVFAAGGVSPAMKVAEYQPPTVGDEDLSSLIDTKRAERAALIVDLGEEKQTPGLDPAFTNVSWRQAAAHRKKSEYEAVRPDPSSPSAEDLQKYDNPLLIFPMRAAMLRELERLQAKPEPVLCPPVGEPAVYDQKTLFSTDKMLEHVVDPVINALRNQAEHIVWRNRERTIPEYVAAELPADGAGVAARPDLIALAEFDAPSLLDEGTLLEQEYTALQYPHDRPDVALLWKKDRLQCGEAFASACPEEPTRNYFAGYRCRGDLVKQESSKSSPANRLRGQVASNAGAPRAGSRDSFLVVVAHLPSRKTDMGCDALKSRNPFVIEDQEETETAPGTSGSSTAAPKCMRLQCLQQLDGSLQTALREHPEDVVVFTGDLNIDLRSEDHIFKALNSPSKKSPAYSKNYVFRRQDSEDRPVLTLGGREMQLANMDQANGNIYYTSITPTRSEMLDYLWVQQNKSSSSQGGAADDHAQMGGAKNTIITTEPIVTPNECTRGGHCMPNASVPSDHVKIAARITLA